jgi:hypothetical protein
MQAPCKRQGNSRKPNQPLPFDSIATQLDSNKNTCFAAPASKPKVFPSVNVFGFEKCPVSEKVGLEAVADPWR